MEGRDGGEGREGVEERDGGEGREGVVATCRCCWAFSNSSSEMLTTGSVLLSHAPLFFHSCREKFKSGDV